MTRRRTQRHGYTLMELLAVVALLLILGAVAAPSLRSLSGDTNIKAAADVIRARMNDARAHAMDTGRTYRVTVSPDYRRIRVTIDDMDPMMSTGFEDAEPVFSAEEELPKNVTATPQFGEGQLPMVDQEGWIRVSTFLPDGTCREDLIQLQLDEPGVHSLMIRLRGLTGAISTETIYGVVP